MIFQKQKLIGVLVLTVFMIGIAFSYYEFNYVKNKCNRNNGAVTEQNISFLAINWSITCEK